MNVYQPMMFVGLGGTGCLVGSELERRLREELCGPDGRALANRVPGQGYLPYQLPSCLQFVYADLNENELSKVRGRVVPSREHYAAATRTHRMTHDLVPRFDTYPQVALSLRTNAPRHVRGWLPPPDGEPRIAPLVKGAGQLPTVGRAALFETFRGGLAPAEQPIGDAIGALSNSADELSRLGGRLGDTCDVFVAFSVAGGTGAGIFYDYLHLIGDAFQRSDYRAQIYPLVLMPSAFKDGLGGGRRAKLNAGPALLDLFRLIDDQNGATVGLELTTKGLTGALGIDYPDRDQVALLPSTIQTAFLFTGSYGVKRDDLHRSIVSLILSLVGTGQDSDGSEQRGERRYQSFADDFINRGVEREVPAASGIGLRGVSTSLVASMSIPVDDLADIVASRLLARATAGMRELTRDDATGNGRLIDEFLSASRLEKLQARAEPAFTDVTPVKGADEIAQELSTRSQTMESNLTSLEDRLRREIPDIVAEFEPNRGVQAALGEVDILRLRRIALGEPGLENPDDRGGVIGELEYWRREPRRPGGITTGPPPLADLRDRRFGTSKMRWADEPVQRIIEDQDAWYQWRTRTAWHAAWADQSSRWSRTFEVVATQINAVAAAFEEQERAEPASFSQRTAELHVPRVGVTYLLPSQRDMDTFYRQTVDRFARRLQNRRTPTEADIVAALLGTEGWRDAWAAAARGNAGAAVTSVRERLKREVKRLFVQSSDLGEEPLLPPMADLLARAARPDATAAATDDAKQFEHKIHGLVPAGFTPQGIGDLKVLISYPAGGPDETIERFLRDQIRLPREASMIVEFRPITAESVTVVLFRTSMSVTEVPEVRELLRHWADAVPNQQPQDFLRWRQRLSYDFRWTVTTEQHRIRIMHHVLCAMWNGDARVGGNADSPDWIRVQIDPEDDTVSMTLQLRRLPRITSWAALLNAYEEWTLADDERIRRDFCDQLLRNTPSGLAYQPDPPDELFKRFFLLARSQQLTARDNRGAPHPGNASRGESGMDQLGREFWTGTVMAALDLPFENAARPMYSTLRNLYEAMSRPTDRESANPDYGDSLRDSGGGVDNYDDDPDGDGYYPR